MFYRGCNYNIDTLKEKYDLFYTARTMLPSWFDDWDPNIEMVKLAIAEGIILPARGNQKNKPFYSTSN